MPRTHCTTRVRNRGHVRLNKDTRQVVLFCYTHGEDEVRDLLYRTVSQRQAEQMEECGEAERVYRLVDEEHRLIGWRLTKPEDPTRQPPPAMLNLSTMNAVANAKDSKLSRHERTQYEKFAVWPLIGDTRAVSVRPRMSDADRQRAEKLLGRRAA